MKPTRHEPACCVLIRSAIPGHGQKIALALEIEPHFKEEAKKRYDATVGRPSKSVEHLPPISPQPKARDQAAAVVGISGKLVSDAMLTLFDHRRTVPNETGPPNALTLDDP